jgi:hypothetical protein
MITDESKTKSGSFCIKPINLMFQIIDKMKEKTRPIRIYTGTEVTVDLLESRIPEMEKDSQRARIGKIVRKLTNE